MQTSASTADESVQVLTEPALLELAFSTGTTLDPEENAATFLDHFSRLTNPYHIALWIRETGHTDQPASFLRIAHAGGSATAPWANAQVLEAAYAYAQGSKDSPESEAGAIFRLKEVAGHFLVYHGNPCWILLLHMPGDNQEQNLFFGKTMARVMEHFFRSLNLAVESLNTGLLGEEGTGSPVQEDLQEENVDRLRSILDRMSKGTFFEDPLRHVVTINDKLFNMFGFDDHENQYEGRPVNELLESLMIQVSDPGPVWDWADAAWRRQENARLEPVRLVDGRFVEISLQPFVTDGQFDGMLWRFEELDAHQPPIMNKKELHERIIEQASDFIVTWNERGYISYANQALCDYLGMAKEDVVGRHGLSFVSKDFRRSIWSLYTAQFTEQQPTTYFEFPVSIREEQEVWIGQHVQLLLDGMKPVGFSAIARQIEGWKHIENNMLKSQQQFLDLFHLSGDALVLLDDTFCVTECNTSALNLFKYGRKEISGVSFFSLLDASQHNRFRHELDVLYEHCVTDWEVKLCRRDASSFTALLSACILQSEDAKVIQVLIQNVEDLNEDEKSDGLLRTLMEGSRTGIVWVSKEGLLTNYNRAAGEMLGWTQAEVIGSEFVERVIPEPFKEAYRSDIKRYFESGTGSLVEKRTEFQASKSDGGLLDVELAFQPAKIGAQQILVGFLNECPRKNIDADSTARVKHTTGHQNEARTQQRENLGQEMRTFLNAVIGMTYLIGDDTESSDLPQNLDLPPQNLRF